MPGGGTGRLRTTGPGLLAAWALTGLVLGRLVRPLLIELDRTAPEVGWVQAAVLYLVAAILIGVARATHRVLRTQRMQLRPHEAVNRLVLAKACALVGALTAGGYIGYALSWLVRASPDLAREQIAMSLVAAGGAVLTVVGSLLLERACRIREDDDES